MRYWIAWGIFLLTVFADLWSKLWIIRHFTLGDRVSVLPVLDIVYWVNRGSAFGAFGQIPWFQFIFLTIAAIVLVIFGLNVVTWCHRWSRGWLKPCFFYDNVRVLWAFSAIAGGGLGNAYERFIQGYVVDFIYVHVGGWGWPAFNIADSMITIGIVVMLIEQIRGWREQRDSQ